MSDWQDLAKAHRDKQYNSIPKDWRLTKDRLDELTGQGTEDEGRLIKLDAVRRSNILSETELDITENYTASQILDELKVGKLTSVDVVLAFSKRAAVAQQLVSLHAR